MGRKGYRHYLKSLLWSTPAGQSILQADRELLAQLIRLNHPYGEEKIGCGIKDIKIKPMGKHKCFMIVREDDTQIDFSYHKILPTKSNWHERNVIAAARCEIKNHIEKIKELWLEENLTLLDANDIMLELHVHHEPPFNNLWSDFLWNKNIESKDIEIIHPDNEQVKWFKDRELANEWLTYHNKHSTIKVMSASLHMAEHKSNDAG